MRKQMMAPILFILVAFVMTFPLIIKMSTSFPGFLSTDESYSPMWNAWWLKFCFVNHLPSNQVDYIAYPFGTTNFFFAYIFFLINFMLAICTNHVFTYNFQVLANLFLAAFFTYLLASIVTKNRISSFLSGVIFGFCPYFFVRSWQHLGETYLWMMPMVLWILFSLKEKPSGSKQVLMVVSIVLAGIVLGTAYYTVIILVSFFVYCIVGFFISRRFSGMPGIVPESYFKRIILLLFIGYLLTAAQYSTYIKDSILNAHSDASVFNPYRRPFEDLFRQSARPLSYFLPATVHPVFGKITDSFIGTELYGDSLTEHTLYLGWVPFILAFVAFRRWKRSKKSPGHEEVASSPENNKNFYIGFFVFLAVAAWLFSQPPWWSIFGFKLYMPSFFMYKILPMFRAYCRFGIVLMLSVAVLAGFGLKFFLERFKSQRTKVAVTALFCGLVLFEFWNWPPYKVIDLSKVPAVYYWIKEQPKDIVIADYPLDADSPNELYKFFQTVHEKKIINGTIPGTYANKVAQEIRRLSQPKTASILKWMGVKYVIVHKDDYLKTDLIEDREDMEKIAQNSGLKFVKSFPPQECPDPQLMCVQKTGTIDVYEVFALPSEPSAVKQ